MIVGVTGYARAGKDSIANILVDLFGFKRIGFADKLKELTRMINPEIDKLLEFVTWEELKQVTKYRKLLQDLGNSARVVLGDNVWIDAALEQISDGNWVVPDVRYPNEFNKIKLMNGKTIRVVRPGIGPLNSHVTENIHDTFDVDYIIQNDGTLNDLTCEVGRVFKEWF